MKNKLFEEIGHILFYAIAIGFGSIAHYFFDNKTGTSEKITFLVVVIALVFMYFFYRLLIIKPKEDKEHAEWQRRFNEDNFRKISTLFRRNNPKEDNAYHVSASAVLKAENKITIVGDYSPEGHPMNVPAYRQTYFLTIESILKNSQREIKYCRFMQREKSIIDGFETHNNIILNNKDVLGDEQAFAHCKRVFDISKVNPMVTFDLYITQFIPSLPSICIIDNEILLFTIPKSAETDGTDTAGVFEFADNTKDGSALISIFYEVTESLKNPRVSKKIKSIEDNIENVNLSYKRFLYDK